MERLRYEDFDLKIEQEGDSYLAKVQRAPVPLEALERFTLPATEKLDPLLLKLATGPAENRRSEYQPDLKAAQELGGNLFRAIFQSTTLNCLRTNFAWVDGQNNRGLRIRLILDKAPALAYLPWEFLFDNENERFLATSQQFPIVRYVETKEAHRRIDVVPPLRILGVLSSPRDMKTLDVKAERLVLETALKDSISEGKVLLDWLEPPTKKELQRQLRRQQYHVFHFIGHGGFDSDKNEG